MSNYTCVSCTWCNKQFERLTKDYNRSKKLGRDMYCSRRCSGCANLAKRGNIANGKGWQYAKAASPNSFVDREPMRYFLGVFRKRQRKEWQDLDLDITYLKALWNLQDGKCAITNIPINLPYGSAGFSDARFPFNASVDRIDSSKGYVKNNVRFVALIVNYAMSNWGTGPLYKMSEAIYNQGEERIRHDALAAE